MLVGLLLAGCQTTPTSDVSADDSRLFRLGQCALRAAEYEEAQEYFSRAVAAAPDNASYHYWLGVSQGRRAGQSGFLGQIVYVRQAAAALKRASELDPQRLEAQEALLEFHLHGPALAGANLAEARQIVDAIARLDVVAGHRARGQLLQRSGQPMAAVEEYRRAMALAPAGGDSGLLLGNLLRDLERYDEAFDVYSGIGTSDVNAASERLAALYQIGATALRSQQRLQDGEQALLEYLRQPYDDARLLTGPAWAHYRLGLIYELLEKPVLAEKHFREAQGDENDPQLARLVKRGLYELELATEYGITVQQLRIYQTLCRVHAHASPASIPCT